MNELWHFASAHGIFDNGCGTGSIISYVLEEYGSTIPETAQILAGDLSDAMLQVLRERRETNINATRDDTNIDPWAKLDIRNIDAHTLSSIPDDSLSHVTGGHLYFLLPAPGAALRTTFRVLKPRGVLALTSGKSSQHIEMLISAVESIKPGTNLHLFKEPWCSEDGVRGELEAAGFTEVETYLSESSLTYTDPGDFTEMLLSMPVMKDVIEAWSGDEKERLRKRLVTDLNRRTDEENGMLKGSSIIALARKGE